MGTHQQLNRTRCSVRIDSDSHVHLWYCMWPIWKCAWSRCPSHLFILPACFHVCYKSISFTSQRIKSYSSFLSLFSFFFNSFIYLLDITLNTNYDKWLNYVSTPCCIKSWLHYRVCFWIFLYKCLLNSHLMDLSNLQCPKAVLNWEMSFTDRRLTIRHLMSGLYWPKTADESTGESGLKKYMVIFSPWHTTL